MYKDMIDFDRLRSDMMDYYGTAMVGGFPMAVMDLSRVEHASEEQLLGIAQEQRRDLRKYLKRISF